MSQHSSASIVLLAPVSGVIVPVTAVPDPTFAEKMVGDGIAIDPTGELLLSPCHGTVVQLHSSCHALTVVTPEGIEILMHIGLDTVLLKGQGFTPKVKTGDIVTPGQPLIAFDADYLARNAASLLTLMVVSNGEKIASYHPASGLAVAGETPALELVPAAGEQTAAGSAPPVSPAGALGSEPGMVLESGPIVILNPAGMHARPAAVLVNNAKQFSSDIRLLKEDRDGQQANAKSVVAIMSLELRQHDRVFLSAKGKDAAEALATLEPLIASGLGDNLQGTPPKAVETPPAAPPRPVSQNPDVLLGVSASPGLVTGQVFQLRHAFIETEEKGKGEEVERQALLSALEEGKKELLALQAQLRLRADTGKAAIFAAHQELLEDPELLDAAQKGIEQGQSAAFAWRTAFTGQADTLRKLSNELIAGRANDIRDIGRRVLVHLTGTVQKAVEMPSNVILIAEDLTPSDTVGLDKSKVLGFCTTGGSSTSHAAILARSASIPAIAAIEERALELANGTPVVLDGVKGELRLNPSQEEIVRVYAAQEQAALARKVELAEASGPAVTTDGYRIKVVGNIGSATEAEEIPALGGEGVGLLRSEFLFLQRAEAPDEEEQTAVYTAIAKTLGPDRDLVVRTLDVGGDKPLAYLPLPPEANPFLGVRGIRLNLLGTDLFRVQVRAILNAAPFSRLHIMFPMVASVEELREAKAIVLREKEALGITVQVHVGIMVEVPSAALLADSLAAEADFFSIGTNDLTQYTLAIDRGHPRLAKMADALHPAVLKLIGKTAAGAHKHGKWVGVCGGLASDILAVPVLLGLGVDELSVSVATIPGIKAEVRRHSMAVCRAMAEDALSMLTATEVREYLTSRAAR